MKYILFLFMLISIWGNSYADTMKNLLQEYENKNYKKAFSLAKTLANNDELGAQYLLAYMYDNGEGAVINKQLAAK